NNRRTDIGWQYDADGNTTSDPSYNQTIDASGALIHSVSHAMVGDGFQHPYEPRLDITQTYDGNGVPAKRQQISRVPGIVDEFGNPGEPMEDTQTTYYIKSSVLGGATMAEIGGGNIIYIYANGERIAREFWGDVTFEHHNPVTGSWLTSHGHSSYRTTAREERDPRGAETPLSNPFAYANSYVEWKFSSPLFIEGGDPFDFSAGLTIDGLPVSQAEFDRRTQNGSAGAELSIGGRPILFVTNQQRLRHISFDVYEVDDELRNEPESHWWGGAYFKGTLDLEVGPGFGVPRVSRAHSVARPQESAMEIARRKNCATPNSIVEQYKLELEAQWERTTRTGEENGSLFFWERAKNLYHRISLSEGKHIRLGTTQYAPVIPTMPEIGPETRNAIQYFSQSERNGEFLAFFHTHPNYPGGDSRSGEPTSDGDVPYQKANKNVLGIIRTGKGYSFFSNGKTFWPNDSKANDCIVDLNKSRN
ncbi:MAG TPA: hypothetical protein VFZ22_00005, partial [Pyrinomonadaceae bacterium]|nr:hypothetical protein [Pyrinomonadaceae bacterium]